MSSGEVDRPTGRRPSISATGRRLLWIGALTIAAVGIATVVTRAIAIRSEDLPADDFTQDYVSARAWTHDDEVYGLQRTQIRRHVDAEIFIDSLRPEHRNPHTPAQVLLVAPLSALSYRDARTIWLLLTSVLMALAIFGVGRSFGLPRNASTVLGLAALAVPVVGNDLLYGQLGGPLLALMVLAWRRLAAGRETGAGIALGVACALKLFPAFLIIPLLRRRMGRGVAATIATAALLGGTSALLIGPSATADWFSTAAPDNFRFWRGSPVNIALSGIPYRWLTASPWRSEGADSPALATVIAVALMLACAIAAFTTRAAISRDPFIAAFPWMLLAGPLTGDLSLPILLPMVFLFARSVVEEDVGPPLRIAMVATIAVAAIGTPPWIAAPGPDLSVATIALGFGLPTIALLAMGLIDGSVGTLGDTR